ncbi:MAG: beta-galactosidase [Bryobacterales bacterium]|nr:beta-galactosidase [Bryobacterales bacterium]
MITFDMGSGLRWLVTATVAVALTCGCAPADEASRDGPMLSNFARDLDRELPLPEYPRPQLVRGQWQNLNGPWEYAITGKDAPPPESFDGEILVPFAAESTLSGVQKAPTPEQTLWYRRVFEVPTEWSGSRVLLHFGAVDFHAVAYVNGEMAGEHKGGYTPFSFDVTDLLSDSPEQELSVSVWDPTDTWTQARGKQVSDPSGIWYTSVTGIWQTVWLEPVPEDSIASLRVESDLAAGAVDVTVRTRGACSRCSVRLEAYRDGTQVAAANGEPGSKVRLTVENPQLWTPDDPNLYDLGIVLARDGQDLDRAASYFGIREIGLGKDSRGFTRLTLNGKPIFMFGPLDQGWWPDGLYTAPTDDALRYDIEVTKQLGFNMARKHVKVEPARWYYHCDRLGLLVWQDMPNGNLRRGQPDSLLVRPTDAEDAQRPEDSAEQFEAELAELIDTFSFFPSVVMWVPFNEGWGQYDVERIDSAIRQWDSTRLVNATSGWTDRGIGDVFDAHMYPGPGMELVSEERATLLGEFGGLGWPVDGHLWWTDRRNWGYRTYFSREELNARYQDVVGNLVGPRAQGLAAAIYTQTTDVEGEVNGLMTYDRELVKFDVESVLALHDRIYASEGTARTLVKTSEHSPQEWEYRTDQPQEGWAQGGSSEGWLSGPAPFQSGNDGNFPTGTVWPGGEIWIRKPFDLDSAPENLWLQAYHWVDEGAVYINGTEVWNFEGTRAGGRHYEHRNLSAYAAELKAGRNVIAVAGAFGGDLRGMDFGLYTVE